MMIASIVYTVFLIVSFIYLMKKKVDVESNFPLKLIGYFILGSFAFTMNQIALPIGFILYLLFFHPTINKHVKRNAAVLGVISFIVVHWVLPYAVDEIGVRNISIKSELASVFTINFQEENELIKENLNLDTDSFRLEDFEVEYTEDGRITDLNWELIRQTGDGYNHYKIQYSTKKEKYQITYSHTDTWLQFDRLIDANRFFENLNQLDIKSITGAKGSYSSYVIRSLGERVNYAMNNGKNYFVDNGEIKILTDDRLPVECYYISTYAMKKTAEKRNPKGNIVTESFASTELTDYLFDVNFEIE